MKRWGRQIILNARMGILPFSATVIYYWFMKTERSLSVSIRKGKV